MRGSCRRRQLAMTYSERVAFHPLATSIAVSEMSSPTVSRFSDEAIYMASYPYIFMSFLKEYGDNAAAYRSTSWNESTSLTGKVHFARFNYFPQWRLNLTSIPCCESSFPSHGNYDKHFHRLGSVDLPNIIPCCEIILFEHCAHRYNIGEASSRCLRHGVASDGCRVDSIHAIHLKYSIFSHRQQLW